MQIGKRETGMAFLSLGLNCKFYLITVIMIVQIRGSGTYDSGLSPSTLKKVTDRHLKSAGGKGMGCGDP